jgi:hypothetical protein
VVRVGTPKHTAKLASGELERENAVVNARLLNLAYRADAIVVLKCAREVPVMTILLRIADSEVRQIHCAVWRLLHYRGLHDLGLEL